MGGKAVNNGGETVATARGFFAKFSRKVALLVILTQIFSIVLGILVFAWTGNMWVAMSIFAIFEIFANVAAASFALFPLRFAAKKIDRENGKTNEPLSAPTEMFDVADFAKNMDEAFAKKHTKRVKTDGPTDDFREIFDDVAVGIAEMDLDGNMLFANSLVSTAGGNLELDFSDKDETLEDFAKNADKNGLREEKTWLRVQNHAQKADDDSRKVFDVFASFVRKNADDGRIFLVLADRTEYYREDEEGMDFVALAAHELRGPITVIRGYLEMLGDDFADPTVEQKQIMDRLNVSAKRLANYVSNILNTSHYDHRHLKLDLEKTEVSDLIDDVREDMELRARTAGRQLLWKIPHDLPSVAADRSSISEVLSNLIDNAVKYSRDGGTVEVFAKTMDDAVQISVRDNGIGIPDNVAEHLFDKFYRSHKSSGVVGGSGLGLYISRAIVESHGGHISVKSVEGEGSTFAFSLPTFASIEDKLANGNEDLVRNGEPRIENHGFVGD